MDSYEPHFLFVKANLNSFDLLNTCNCINLLLKQNFLQKYSRRDDKEKNTPENRPQLGYLVWWKGINILSYSAKRKLEMESRQTRKLEVGISRIALSVCP